MACSLDQFSVSVNGLLSFFTRERPPSVHDFSKVVPFKVFHDDEGRTGLQCAHV